MKQKYFVRECTHFFIRLIIHIYEMPCQVSNRELRVGM